MLVPRGVTDPILMNRMVANDAFPTTFVRGFLTQLFDPRRNINFECGYPDDFLGAGIGSLNPDMYKSLYEREAIPARVVQVLPKESWQVQPRIFETEDSEVATEFEQAWDSVDSMLRGEQSWYQDEEGSPIWEHLMRADILSGIGHFGVLLLGLDDGKRLDEPVDGVVQIAAPLVNADGKLVLNDAGKPKFTLPPGQRKSSVSMPSKEVKDDKEDKPPVGKEGTFEDLASTIAGAQGTDAQYVGVQLSPPEFPSPQPSKEKRNLTFLRSFDESLVQVVQYEANVGNPRFGEPVMYRITLNDPREMHSGIGLPLATVRVHWSRVIHLADNRGSSEIFGVPRMRPVLNRLLDLRKLYSGSAEMYWRGALPGWAFETHPQLGGDVEIDQQAHRDMLEQYGNGMQRYLTLMGMSAKSLAPQVVDPTPQITAQLEAICIQLGIPVRVFKGSERGELASNQDDASWNDRLRNRQQMYITPRIIIPFINRLISCGVLPVPGKGGKEQAAEAKVTANSKVYRVKTRDYGNGWIVVNAQDKKPGFESSDEYSPPTEDPKVTATDQDAAEADKPDDEKSSAKFIADQGYSIEWPDLDSMGKKDKAAVALSLTQALAAYVSGGVEQLIPPQDYLTHIAEMDEEEAAAILQNADEHTQEQEAKDIDKQHQMIDEGLMPDPTKTPTTLDAGQSMHDPMTGKTLGKAAHKPAPGGAPQQPAFGQAKLGGKIGKPPGAKQEPPAMNFDRALQILSEEFARG